MHVQCGKSWLGWLLALLLPALPQSVTGNSPSRCTKSQGANKFPRLQGTVCSCVSILKTFKKFQINNLTIGFHNIFTSTISNTINAGN
jgi:hypothetical protein